MSVYGETVKYLVDLPPSLVDKVRRVLEKGSFGSFHEFIITALENQARAEEGDVNPWLNEETRIEEIHPVNQSKGRDIMSSLLVAPKEPLRFFMPPLGDNIEPGPFWGQYYKFLPTKLAVRVLYNLTKEKYPDYRKYRDDGATCAVAFGRELSKLDDSLGHKFGYRIGTGFPSKGEKSTSRFMDQYLVYVSPNRKLVRGLPAKLKFINFEEEGSTLQVGLTEAGYRFADLVNPVIDHTGKNAISSDEAKFLLEWLQQVAPAETKHMLVTLQLISSEATSRTQLNEQLELYYTKDWPGLFDWSEGVVNTMRAGVISRMVELGLVTKRKEGITVNYQLTPAGVEWSSRVKNVSGYAR